MNVANALGVYVLLSAFGVSDREISDGFKSFTGVVPPPAGDWRGERSDGGR